MAGLGRLLVGLGWPSWPACLETWVALLGDALGACTGARCSARSGYWSSGLAPGGLAASRDGRIWSDRGWIWCGGKNFKEREIMEKERDRGKGERKDEDIFFRVFGF